jgi:hypothetical protein
LRSWEVSLMLLSHQSEILGKLRKVLSSASTWRQWRHGDYAAGST